MEKMNEKTIQLIIIKRNVHAKQTRKEDMQVQCLLISLYSSNHNILRFWNRFDEQDLKSLEKLISNQKLL